MEHIYALYLNVGVEKLYFYVGRTGNLERRMREHAYLIKNGKEDKYIFLRTHSDYTWGYEVLRTCKKEEDNCLELYYQLKLMREGWTLTNMKACDDVYPAVISPNILRTFKIKPTKVKVKKDTGDAIFVDDLTAFLKKESPGLAAIRAKRHISRK